MTQKTKSYVVLQPRSNTNPSARFRVVEFDSWCRFRNGDALSYEVASDHSTWNEAYDAAATLNDAPKAEQE